MLTDEQVAALKETLLCACVDGDPDQGVEDKSLFTFKAAEIIEVVSEVERLRRGLEAIRDRSYLLHEELAVNLLAGREWDNAGSVKP